MDMVDKAVGASSTCKSDDQQQSMGSNHQIAIKTQDSIMTAKGQKTFQSSDGQDGQEAQEGQVASVNKIDYESEVTPSVSKLSPTKSFVDSRQT